MRQLYFLGTPDDKPYLPRLKSHVSTCSVSYSLEPISTWAEIEFVLKKKGITSVFTTSPKLLSILARKDKVSLSNYAGSLFKRGEYEILVVPPLEHLITKSEGSHLLSHYLTKLYSPESWTSTPAFNFLILTPSNIEDVYAKFQKAYVVAVDIETYKKNLAIRCIGYTALFPDNTSLSVVLPLDDTYYLTWMRKFNELKAPKIFQNGKYDCAYLLRYNAPPYNYLWDTATLFHSWYSELPKDLAFLQGYCVRESMYWKDLSETNDLHEYYLYNAKDTHATLCAWMYMLDKMPQWAKENYLQEFPVNFPCILAEATGIKRDPHSLSTVATQVKSKIEVTSTSLNKMISTPNFNTNSPVQVKALLKVLGCGDLESTDEKNLNKAIYRHPLNAIILNKILDIRGYRKLLSTYLVEGKELNGRILYAINPHGTDTGRCSSNEHHFWCGLNIQNIPRGKEVKATLKADPGFWLYECDLEQAESRDTAFISGDTQLQRAVTGTKDFHSLNASAFFGRSYESIYDDEKKETKDKSLRDLAKRVNHGANYNMGANTLVDTMGERNITLAQTLLNLPKLWTHKQIAEHLLSQFHKTYPSISAIYYKGVVHEILSTKRLSSKARHECNYQASSSGWTRYCFGSPDKNKLHLNAYVAHGPQSLNAMTLNRAFVSVFYELALAYPNDFRLLAQIHDSILFQVRKGCEHLAQRVKELMEIPVKIRAYSGVDYEFVVPAALKGPATYWSEL